MNITYNEALKEVRATTRRNGLVFKKLNDEINGKQAYKFEVEDNGLIVATNFTLWSAYECCMSGYIDEMGVKYNDRRTNCC